MIASALYGQAASAVLIGAAASYLPVPRRKLAGLLIVPAAFFTIAPALHSLLSAPSFTLTQLALWRLLYHGPPVSPDRRSAGLLVIFAALFYPLSLGLGPFDPFDIGYRPLPLLPVVAVLGLWLAWRRQERYLLLLSLDLLAYAGGLFGNLWNALFDPVLVALAICRLVRGRMREAIPAHG